MKKTFPLLLFFLSFFFFFFFCLFRADPAAYGGSQARGPIFVVFACLSAFSRDAPAAYGGSQARGLIRGVAPGLCHSHSNTRSKAHLRPTPQLRAMPDP